MTRPKSGAPARSSAALPQAIRQWREQAVSWVRATDPDTAALLAKRKQTGSPRVVVIGETNRGKSSMVNALLGAPGLSPVDAGLATCTYLQFSHGASPTAVAHFGGGMADITFPATELRVWATMDSEPDHDLPPPRWIEVAVPSPLLQTVTLVDTPGVGGLVAGHADLAAEAAAAATALLFVVDASAPFTRGELAFLEQVGDRVDSVHFVVTKTDVFRGWREIVAADQQLLARHVPRFTDAPFHPISSTLAAAADAQADPKIAEMIREQSGVVTLRRILADDVVARASLLADANLIRQAVTVIRGDVQTLDGERRALTNGAERADHLKRRREELLNQRRTGGGRSWQVRMRAEISRARVDLTHETAREVREASQMFRGAIDAADNDQLKQLPFHIDAYAQAMTSRAHGRLLEAMNRIVNAVLVELFTEEELELLAGTLATRPYAPLVTRGPDRTRSADETIMAAAGGGIGFSVGAMLKTSAAAVLPGAFGVALLPVTLVLGSAAAFFLVRSRRRVQDRQHLKTWLAEVLGEAKAQIDQNIAEQFIEADEQLTLALDDALTKQVTTIESEIKQVDGALKLDATERAGRLRTLDERRSSGVTLVNSGESLLDRIRNTRPASSVMLPGVGGASRQIALPPGLPTSPPPMTPGPAGPPAQGEPVGQAGQLGQAGQFGQAGPLGPPAPAGPPEQPGHQTQAWQPGQQTQGWQPGQPEQGWQPGQPEQAGPVGQPGQPAQAWSPGQPGMPPGPAGQPGNAAQPGQGPDHFAPPVQSTQVPNQQAPGQQVPNQQSPNQQVPQRFPDLRQASDPTPPPVFPPQAADQGTTLPPGAVPPDAMGRVAGPAGAQQESQQEAQHDRAVPDTAVPDTALPDTAAPDTAAPDTAVPDTALPDTVWPDGPRSDEAAATPEHPQSDSGFVGGGERALDQTAPPPDEHTRDYHPGDGAETPADDITDPGPDPSERPGRPDAPGGDPIPSPADSPAGTLPPLEAAPPSPGWAPPSSPSPATPPGAEDGAHHDPAADPRAPGQSAPAPEFGGPDRRTPGQSAPTPEFGATPLITGVPGRPGRAAPIIPAAGALNAVLGRAGAPESGTIAAVDVPRPDRAGTAGVPAADAVPPGSEANTGPGAGAHTGSGTEAGNGNDTGSGADSPVRSDDDEDLERTRIGPRRTMPPVPFERGPGR